MVVCSIGTESVLFCDRSPEDNCTATMTVLPMPPACPPGSLTPYTLSSVTSIVAASADAGSDGIQDLYFIGGSPASPMGVHKLQIQLTGLIPQYHADLVLLQSSMSVLPAPGYISSPQHIQFPTRLFGDAHEARTASGDCDRDGPVAHGLFYSPCNEEFRGEHDQRPPLLVKIHG
jgi:hypothetical protein